MKPVLRLRNTTAINSTGLPALDDPALRLKEQPSDLMNQAGFVRLISKENFCSDLTPGPDSAVEMHSRMEPLGPHR